MQRMRVQVALVVGDITSDNDDATETRIYDLYLDVPTKLLGIDLPLQEQIRIALDGGTEANEE